MLERLDETLKAAGIPILGVAVTTDRVAFPPAAGSVRIDYRPAATAAQRAQAESILAGFDWSEAAHAAWAEDRQPERKAVRQLAAPAIADLDAYLALFGPTSRPTEAQTQAQVRRHAQILRAVIRRLNQIES